MNDNVRNTSLAINLRDTTKDDKILNLVQYKRGYRGPPLSIIDIISRSYAEPNSTDRLKDYPTFVIDRVLQERTINFTKDTPRLEKKTLRY